ncbi:glycoside hydrolase family 3 protein [Dissoconium aciculare CBS 342.82]|uniref:beta-glucosidase n=1 Tax=Dissoconium aciculare CBS 342.82 TaxID=1314786 RepID=A0A6J3LVL2_9PEZI|nr:glycoside hydrolase family 3 protein [Dissoconium aciculare CBS 342.82]KAF1819718.1 glycoside hydrolase family 3 protein [Dissoconium aciculare CBS 342.82]
MTLLEMANITYGFSGAGPCSGVSGSIPRLGYPGMCFQDAGQGVRGQDGVNAYPAGLHVGASWNRELALERGQYLGAEFNRKGVSVALGPMVGPLGRVATGGRLWEGFASDPYLSGQLVIPTIQGMQENVVACVKHLVANEQETNRSTSLTHPGGQAVSSNLDDKTLHELYLWPFDDAVEAGVGIVMCSYNRVNQTYACENEHLQKEILKGELGFRGFILSDWNAQHNGLLSATSGLDVVMPTSSLWDNGQLAGYVTNGSLPRADLEDKALRILATWYKFGLDTNSTAAALGAGQVSPLTTPHEFVNARDPASAPSIYKQAQEGHVLVKNVNNALPLKKPRVLSIFGQDAFPQTTATPILFAGLDLFSYNFQSLIPVILQAYAYGTATPGTLNGTLTVGGGSGGNTAPYISTPWDAIQQRTIEDGTQLFWDASGSTEPEVVGYNDACLVFLNAFASEGWDRLDGLTDPAGDALVLHVASKCKNTMVFIHNAGARLVDAWVDHPNVTAVMFAHVPGQDSGRAIASLIYGDVSPSGRLPYTVAKNQSDYGSLLFPVIGAPDNFDPQSNFTEGVEIDYRSFLARDVTPRYAFGYGLTYSTFSYSNLTVEANGALEHSHALTDNVMRVTASITNTGKVTAAEVPQLYLSIPGASTKVLRGFTKTSLCANVTAEVEFLLRRKDLSQWDVTTQKWFVPSGDFTVEISKSVLDVQLTATFTL